MQEHVNRYLPSLKASRIRIMSLYVRCVTILCAIFCGSDLGKLGAAVAKNKLPVDRTRSLPRMEKPRRRIIVNVAHSCGDHRLGSSQPCHKATLTIGHIRSSGAYYSRVHERLRRSLEIQTQKRLEMTSDGQANQADNFIRNLTQLTPLLH